MRTGFVKYSIPFIKPHFPASEDITHDYDVIVSSNWFTNFGPYEQRLRKEVKGFLNLDVDVVTVSNATLGLDVAISGLFVLHTTKKEVIMPSFTFAAGAEMLLSHGFTPVFIDIETNSLQPSISEAQDYILNNTDKVCGILLCNIFGVGNPEIEEWEKLAETHSLPLIIDSAAGFGSEYSNGEKIGGRGDCEIFSLHATKPFAVGEGGLIVTKNHHLAARLRELTNFGFDSSKQIKSLGTNAKMQELNAAIGIRQLEGFEERLRIRRRALDKYKQELIPYGFLFQSNDHKSTVPFVSVLTPAQYNADTIIEQLHIAGIEARKYYKPLHHEEVITKDRSILLSLDKTDDVYQRIISLPLHDNMEEKDILDITKEILGRI